MRSGRPDAGMIAALKSFGITIFLGAFLLFLVQPLIGKTILPWFGSSPGVWTTCLLFFQVLLLGGYAYAHLLVSRLPIRAQVITHIVLLVGALAMLPIAPSETFATDSANDPTWPILLLLATSIGVPYLILSATGPLLQAWFARSQPGRSPYRLYALSNIGSILALVSYPFVIEPVLGLGDQTVLWSAAFGAFALCCGWCALHSARARSREPEAEPARAVNVTRPSLVEIGLWLGLSACGSGLLMATTNRLCTDVAVIPFLWVLPLGLYLLTFVICFDRDLWYARPFLFAILPVALAAAALSLHRGVDSEIGVQVATGAGVLFFCLMCCHGELARLRPSVRHLTLFYLVIALGGALGGLFVAVVAPVVFTGFWEYPLLLLVSYGLVCFAAVRGVSGSRVGPPGSLIIRIGSGFYWSVFAAVTITLTVLYLDTTHWLDAKPAEPAATRLETLIEYSRIAACGIIILAALAGVTFWLRRIHRHPGESRSPLRHFLPGVCVLGLVPLVGTLGWHVFGESDRLVEQGRNFYGVLTLEKCNDGDMSDLTLSHGRILHGFQYQNVVMRTWPTTYYGPWSGVGIAIRRHPDRHHPDRSFRIGVIGLGAGTVAAYGNAHVMPDMGSSPYVRPDEKLPGDHVVFYEINPMVDVWARRHFTYRADAESRGAIVETHLGDARIIMERQIERGERQAFDVLAIDAFNSDAIPIHLLTNECFQVYTKHLAEDGILAFHVTNRHLDLAPVVHRLARHNGWSSSTVGDAEDDVHGVSSSDWVLVTRNEDFLDIEVEALDKDTPIPCPLWTDDYSSVFPLLK
jgi:hypothetical protein